MTAAAAAVPAVPPPAEALARLESLRRGEALAYHAGLLAADRDERHLRRSFRRSPRALELDRLARRALELAETGRVSLAQRRLGDGSCLYLARGRA